MYEKLVMVFIKTFFMNLCIAISFFIIKGNKKYNKAFIIILDIIVSFCYLFIHKQISNILYPVYINIACYIVFLSIAAIYYNETYINYIISLFIAMSFSFMTFFFSGTIIYILFTVLNIPQFFNSILEYLLIGIFQLIQIVLLFKIKRFKDGFSFLKEDSIIKNVISTIVMLFIIISIVFIKKSDIISNIISTIGVVVVPIIIAFTIKKALTLHYKSKLKDQTIEVLNNKVEEQEKQIHDLQDELNGVLKINHKYNRRISAMEQAVSKINFGEEYAKENTEIIDLVNNLTKNYREELDQVFKLQKTNIYCIDNFLEYMYTKTRKDNIDFEICVNCDIKNIVERFIDSDKLETLLSDHISDAIIAINYSDRNERKIKLEFNKIDDIYEIRFYDSGIEFEIETLLKLGKEQVTTHKDSGGTGIGFVTTFDTLNTCKGSLVIEEFNNNIEGYTKVVTIRFDNKSEFIIKSFRADDIKNNNKNIATEEKRIIIEQM